MHFVKQLSMVMTVAMVLAIPFGIMGCAKESSEPTSTTPADTNSDSDLGEPEAGSDL